MEITRDLHSSLEVQYVVPDPGRYDNPPQTSQCVFEAHRAGTIVAVVLT